MAFSLGPALGGLIEEVESAETLRVGVFEVFEFAFQEDVFFGDVAEDEGDFCFVVGVFENGARELVHTIIHQSAPFIYSGLYVMDFVGGRIRTE